jgi:peptide/nickel transport system permease protein
MRYLLRRLLRLAAVLFAVSLLTFLATNSFGDPVKARLGPLANDKEARAQVTKELDLGDPVPVRYVKWLGDVLQGDLGRSYITRESVSAIIGRTLPVSLFVMVYAQVLALLLAVPIAIWSAYRADRFFDRASTTLSFGLLSVPAIALGPLLIYVFAVSNHVFPSRYLDDTFLDQLYSLFLPALTLALPLGAAYMRILRTDMVRTLQEDFVIAARAKGLPTRRILVVHALRPSTFSLLTVVGIQVGALLGGGLVVEIIYSLPGLGREIVRATLQDNYVVVQAIVLVIATAFVLINFIVDALYGFLDPRVRSVRGL